MEQQRLLGVEHDDNVVLRGGATQFTSPDAPSVARSIAFFLSPKLSFRSRGAGFGFFQSPNLRALMSSAPPERASGASGMIALARLTGQASGAAGVALCFALGGTHGAKTALALGCGTAALGAMASTARLFTRAR